MSSNDERAYHKELEWLAFYYHQHGFKEKAQEILQKASTRTDSSNGAAEVFSAEEQHRA